MQLTVVEYTNYAALSQHSIYTKDSVKGAEINITMDIAHRQQLAAYLTEQREQRHISKRKLADMVGVDDTQIVRLEQGGVASPRAEVLRRIAESLELPVADILTAAGYPVVEELPSFTPYLRAKYTDLPETAVTELEGFFAYLAQKHGVDSPVDGEDEH